MKVKVKKTRGVTGNQHNYSLVTGSIWNYEDKPTTNTVGTTLRPVPRDEANIEAEKDETVVYPDKDGMLSHAKIGGKRHSQGGTPLNVPDGSFVFSDYRGMNIKNKELLKNVFNMNTNKAVTPADIAKRYEINYYKKLLKDPWTDPMDKKTAQLMIENNMRKLGQLALIQEAKKGFPDGIPDISMPLMASSLGQAQPSPQPEEGQLPMGRFGGLPKHQKVGPVQAFPRVAGPVKRDSYGEIKVFGSDNYYEKSGNKVVDAQEKSAIDALYNYLRHYGTQMKDYPYGAQQDVKIILSKYPHLASVWQGTDGNSWLYTNSSVDEVTSKESQKTILQEKLDQGLAKRTAEAVKASQKKQAEAAAKQKAQQKTQQEAEKAKSLGLVTSTPTVRDQGDAIKRQLVQSANKIYNEAVLSGDPKKMREAAQKLKEDKFDISGWSTFTHLLGDLTLGPNFINRQEPWGWTWQDKIDDMSRVLSSKADFAEHQKTTKNAQAQVKKDASGFASNYNEVKSAVEKILNDPNAKPEDVATAASIYEDITNSGTYFPLNPRVFVNPYTINKNDPYSTYPYMAYSDYASNLEQYKKDLSKIVQSSFTNEEKKAQEEKKKNEASGKNTMAGPEVGDAFEDATTTTESQDNSANQSSNQSSSRRSSNTNTYVAPRKSSNVIINKGSASDDWGFEEQKLGGDIERFQTKGQFNLKNPELLDYAKKKATDQYGYYFTRPQWFDYTTDVGDQSPSQNPDVYTRTSEGLIVPKTGFKGKDGSEFHGIGDLINYADPYVNFEDYASDEAALKFANTNTSDADRRNWALQKFQQDLAGSEADRKKAGTWYVDRLNAYNKAILGPDAPETIDTRVDRFWEPGYEWLNEGFAYKKPKTPPPGKQEEKNEKTEVGDVDKANYQGPGYSRAPWWNYDVVNYANQLGNYFDIEPGNLPPYLQYNPFVADPTFLDPARAIAQQQGVGKQAQEAMMASGDPTLARANVIASQAQVAPQVANIMAQYDQNNVGIANQFGQQAAQTMNQAQLQSLNFKQQRAAQLETRRQQYLNALREGKTDVAQAIMQGMKNAAETSWVNATSDSYAVDPSTGTIYFKQGFDPVTQAYRDKTGSVAELAKKLKKEGFEDKTIAAIIAAQMRSKSGMGATDPMENIWNLISEG